MPNAPYSPSRPPGLPLARRRWLLPLIGLSCLVVISLPQPASAQQRLTSSQVREVRLINKGIERAARLYQNRNFAKSAELIQQLSADLRKLVEDKPSAILLAAVQPEHQKLVQARDLLVAAGQSLPAIPALPAATVDPNAPVSFTGEVASILNTNCGNCHVQRNRGQFSMATFDSLAAGVDGAPVVVPGKPDESRMIEAIEEGSMPPNGTVPEAQVARLKKWIADGAGFDGQNRQARLDAMARTNAPTRREPEIRRPAGNETVSFSREVAPVLMANCMGCHYEPRNVRGGLRMDNFRQLLRGGDSGPLIQPGDGANSLLIQRLTSTDRQTRMPRGRRPLEKEVIDRIITWIDEGARFDGRGGRMNLREVSAIAASEAASHEELTSERQQESLRQWKKVMSDVGPRQVGGQHVFVTGPADSSSLEEFQGFADAVAGEIKTRLGLEKQAPLVKGQIAMFVFERRYDYSEFGKMIEQRDLPKSWRSHWGYNTVDAYAAVLSGSNSLEELKPELTQRLSSVAVASLGSDVPEWFADGFGYVIAERLIDDKSVAKTWREQSTTALREMQNPTDFLQGRLANDRSGLVAYAFVRWLQEQSPRDFKKFLEAIREGTPFNTAFAAAWSAPPVRLIQQLTGSGGRNNRQRQNRRPGR